MLDRSRSLLIIAVIGILLHFGFRLHNIAVLPLFIDETIVVGESEAIAGGTFIHHAPFGKFALPYFLLPFQPTTKSPWIIRTSLLLWACIGFAGALAIVRRYGADRWAVVAAAVMLACSPMLFFFDRLVLGDTMAHVAVTLWLLSLLRLFDEHSPRYELACISGILFVVCLLSKATTLLLIPLPIVMAVLVARWSFSSRVKCLGLFYVSAAMLWVPFTLALASRDLDYFWQYGNFASPTRSLLDLGRFGRNISFLLEAMATYHHWAFLMVSGFACLLGSFLMPRIMLSILLGIAGYCFAISLIIDDLLFGRYFVPVLPLYFVATSIAVSALARSMQRQANRLLCSGIFVLLGLWAIAIALPFIASLYIDPPKANLFRGDRIEYIQHNSSGYGIPELAQYLLTQSENGPNYVVGAFVGCETLSLYLAPPPPATYS